MKLKFLFSSFLCVMLMSCHFNETLILNPDGSGSMNLEVNLDQMMELTQSMGGEENTIKTDTLIVVKDLLAQKKDSIAKLPKKDQENLKKMEMYKIHFQADSDKNKMRYNLLVDFKDVQELDEINNALSKLGSLAPMAESDGFQNTSEDKSSNDLIGVRFSFANNTFKREGYIKDKIAHQQQMDSLKPMEGFFGTSLYTLKYSFPKKITKISNSDAEISSDKKSVRIEAGFLEYFENPKILDLEVELEN